LIALGISTSISAVLVPAFIRGWSGLPQLGIVSGPYAAALAYAVSLSWLFVWLLRTRSPLAPDRELLRQLAIDGAVLKRLLQLGMAGGTYYVFLSLSEIAVIGFVNRFGSQATAAYGAFVQIVAYVQLPVVSIGITAAIFTAQAIGAGRATELSRVARTAIGLSFGMEGCLVVIVYHFHREIVGWFITAPATAQMAAHLLDITLWSYLILGIVHALAGTMRGSGTVLWPTIFALTAIWGVEVPVAYLLSYRIGLDGIWVAFPITFVASCTLQAAYYRFVWRKMHHARLV
jgi:putative MATE family efflux protein